MIAAADRIDGKIGENLRKALPWLPTARKLVTIQTEGDLPAHVVGPVDALRVKAPDSARVRDLFTRWEFKALLQPAAGTKTTGKAEAVAPARPRPPFRVAVNAEYDTVLTDAQLDAWIAKVNAAPLTSIDVAYTGFDPMQGCLVGIALAVEPERGCYIPLAHRYAGAPDQLPFDATLARLKPWLESEQRKRSASR